MSKSVKFSDLSGVYAVLAVVAVAILVPLMIALGFGILMAVAAVGIFAVNTIAGHVILALTWMNVFAVAAVLWVLRFILGAAK
ncbi:hypothetical protein V5E97_06790 [Singulisphaera sp. Ch08]|uniref:Uncharacterized protein n=1 Tax=Singulisphaera sp. Ch08 TaxID=3120278 RepID=A0AAU7CKE3_9BACT